MAFVPKGRFVARTLAASAALAFALSGCSSSSEEESDAACLLLDQCSTIKVANDREACDAVTTILAPMNDGSNPSVAKFEKAWTEIESLAFQAEDAALVDALNKTSINMNSFVMEMKENGKASNFIMNALGSNLNALFSACANIH